MAGKQVIILRGQTQIDTARQYLARMPKDGVVTFEPPRRTKRQNAKLWPLLEDISMSKPDGREHTPEMWKALMMHACGHAVQFLNGLDGLPFPVGFSSSKLSKEQMAELITFTLQWGDEHRVNWTWDN